MTTVLHDDEQLMVRQQEFLDAIERMIRAANREIIHRHIPVITGDDVMKFAVVVAELRGRYLDIVKQMVEREHGVVPDYAEIGKMARAREMFDEASHAFEALRRAIERGYVDITIQH